MSTAICFKCGTMKPRAFEACSGCGVAPSTNSEHAVSLALSDYLSASEQLAQYAHEIRGEETPSIPRRTLERAFTALKDPQLQAMLEERSSNPGPTVSSKPPLPDPNVAEQKPTPRKPTGRMSIASVVTELDRSAFMVLGATIRDSRKRIVELAEEKALELPQDVCQKARSDLTNPRTRLGVEMAWLPGVSPRKASDLIGALHSDPASIRRESGLPVLAQLNLESAAFESMGEVRDPSDLARFIAEFASLADALDPEDVLRDLNEDRSVAGFPEVKGAELVESELTERKRYYRTIIKSTLEKLSTPSLIRVMTDTVGDATCEGTEQAPSLIDDLVDSYEVETQGFLQKEAENVKKLIKATSDAAPKGEAATKQYADQLEAVARNWDKVAQPIQLSARARGTDHEPSRELAYAIRGVAIELFKKHDMLALAQRLTSLLQELFAEIPDVAEQLQDDAGVLRQIAWLEPIREMCARVGENIEHHPDTAYDEGQRLLRDGRALLDKLSANASHTVGAEANDLIAQTLTGCAIAYGNKTSAWERCALLLTTALDLATSEDTRKRINDNLGIVRNNQASLGGLDPVQKAPSLHTVYGVGFTLYGQADKRQSDNSYVATYYFVILMIPIIPIARYRVIPINGGYRFLAKGGVTKGDVWRSVISIGTVIVGLLILSSF